MLSVKGEGGRGPGSSACAPVAASFDGVLFSAVVVDASKLRGREDTVFDPFLFEGCRDKDGVPNTDSRSLKAIL